MQNLFTQLAGWTKRQSRLFWSVMAYLASLLIFLLVWRSDYLKYLVALAGVVLAAFIPDIADKKHLRRRLFFLAIPTAGILLIQIVNDLSSEAKVTALSAQITAHSEQFRVQHLPNYKTLI